MKSVNTTHPSESWKSRQDTSSVFLPSVLKTYTCLIPGNSG